jgi:outer membrane protein assembly factor BamB
MRVLMAVALLILAGCAPGIPAASNGPADPPGGWPSPGPQPSAHAADAPTYRGDMGRSGQMPGPVPFAPISQRWVYQATDPVATSVAIVGDRVYVVDSGGIVACIDVADGTLQWTASVGAISSPTVVGGDVFVGTATGLVALDAATGAQGWSDAADGPVDGAPAAVGDRILFATETGTVEAVSATTGQPVWTASVGAAVTRTLAIQGDTAFTGVRGGDAVAIDVSDGSTTWRTSTNDAGDIGTAVAVDGRIYISTGLDATVPTTHETVALDAGTGAIEWRYPSSLGGAIYPPAIGAGLAIVPSDDGTITALAVRTGAPSWSFTTPGPDEAVAAIVGDLVVVPDDAGHLFGLDLTTGVERWRAPIRGIPYGPTVADGLVVVGTNLGLVTAFGGAR